MELVMKTCNTNFVQNALAVAVRTALAAMFAMPMVGMAQSSGDEEAAALKRPVNYVEIGAMNVSNDSAKFGEYTGLTKSGGYAVGNFSLRGGDAYGAAAEGTSRWFVTGTDLGLTSRDLAAGISSQGQWKVGVHYDELNHAITDSYQSPFQGTMGGNTFTLPTSFGVINTTAITGSNNPAVGTRNLSAAQQAAFQTYDVGTSRKNSAISVGYNLGRQWSLQFDFNRLNQNGAKLINGASSDARTGTTTAGAWAKEAPVTLMNPTNYTTDTASLALNWIGEKGYASATYFTSIFSDGYNSLSWMSPLGTGSNTTGAAVTTLAGGYQPDMLSTMPSNTLQQLNVTGGYALAPGMKLAGGLSYGRNTQDEAYLVDMMQTGGLPRTSLNGLVVTTNANLKLTDQATRDLSLSAGLKYNERDNRSPSDVYRMFDIGGGPAAAANAGTRRTEINTPYSLRKAELELAADYRLGAHQNLRLAYDRENLTRWCNDVAGAAAPSVAIVGNIVGNAPSPAGANCVIVPSSEENKLGLTYRLRASDDLNFNAGYSHARRTSTVDNNALTPLNDQAGSNATGIVNASNYKGYDAFFDASREQDLAKFGINWQAAERLNLGLNGRYSRDRYFDSVLGVQDGHTSSLNLDASYSYSENRTVAAYVSAQERDRNMKSGASGLGATDNATSYAALVAPTNVWTNRLNDRDLTFGLNSTHKGLMGGKLELSGDLSVSVGKSGYHTEVPYYVPTATGPTCDNATVLSCGDTPEIYSRTLQFKLNGIYQLNKHSGIALGYQYQKQKTNDYYYNVYQLGFSSSTMLPTNQQAPNYTVNVITAAYRYTF
jgi:MtrB/PioB family decaheme-associated outer membrane protein